MFPGAIMFTLDRMAFGYQRSHRLCLERYPCLCVITAVLRGWLLVLAVPFREAFRQGPWARRSEQSPNAGHVQDNCLSWKTSSVFDQVDQDDPLQARDLCPDSSTHTSHIALTSPFSTSCGSPIPPLVFLTMPTAQGSNMSQPYPKLHHVVLDTTFAGISHAVSTPDTLVHQYLGIKYASIPARFRQSKLFNSYPTLFDASKHGFVDFILFFLSFILNLLLTVQSVLNLRKLRPSRNACSILSRRISRLRHSNMMNLNA